MFRTLVPGETELMSEREDTPRQNRQSTYESAGRRGTDDRRTPVSPSDDPAPVSPDPDREAIHKGEDVLERVKPY
jgi:hypothetical protein